MRITIAALSGTLLGMSVPLIAADGALSELREGDRIRLSTPALDEQRSVAGLVGIEGDTLIVRLPDRQEPTRIPLSEVGKLEVARGTKSRMGRGALIGGLAGMLLGGGAVAAHLGGGGELGESSAVALVAGGLAAGSLIGFTRPKIRCDRIEFHHSSLTSIFRADQSTTYSKVIPNRNLNVCFSRKRPFRSAETG